MDYPQFTVFLSTTDKTVISGGGDTKTETTTGTATDSTAPANGGILDMGMWIVIYAVLIGGLYFFMSRPQKKREKQLKELQASIKVGDNVVTSGGFYGKVVDTADDLYIIEFGTNKGIRIPVNKAEVFPSKEKTALDEKSN